MNSPQRILSTGLFIAIGALMPLVSCSGGAQAADRGGAVRSAAVASRASAGSRGVKAVLLHPWGNCSPAVGWNDVATNWSTLGTKRVTIDSTTFCSAATQITYAALVANKATVLVFSDCAGDDYQFTSSEVAAITEYVQAGHNVVGTYATFLDTYNNPADNAVLGPLFGLTSKFSGTPVTVTPDYTITSNLPALFRNVPNPYDSSGYGSSQTPAAGIWDQKALDGAKYRARTSGDVAAITTFASSSYHYKAVYISSMPEYSPSATDEQFLYNALTLAP